MTDLDLKAIEAKWLTQCGPCDFGLDEYGCNCPVGDYRNPMSHLVSEIRRLRAVIDRVTNLCRRYTPEPPPLFSGPGLSEHGVGFNHGTRTMADAVLGTITPEDDDS